MPPTADSSERPRPALDEQRVGGIREVAERIDERAVEIEHEEPNAHSVYSAYDVGVSHTLTRTTGRPCSLAWRKMSCAMCSTVGLLSQMKTGSPSCCSDVDERIVVAQQHPVIELAVDPAFHDPLDVAEIAHHVARVELRRPDFDLRDRVVAVRVLADAVVVEQPVAVAEVDALGDGVHLVIS